ncbi:hypothetical protein L484_022431 [Morus notabilis]|uniref:Uncharacterized protein n=1 Tax=Morus notabilis TaxID=981085 RepID=W9RE74_9ROSA|nr:hypothetical protein L484_022431 [Morus notabilis]
MRGRELFWVRLGRQAKVKLELRLSDLGLSSPSRKEERELITASFPKWASSCRCSIGLDHTVA